MPRRPRREEMMYRGEIDAVDEDAHYFVCILSVCWFVCWFYLPSLSWQYLSP